MVYVLVLLLAGAAGAAVGVATLRVGATPQGRPASWTRSYEEPAPLQEEPSRGAVTTAREAPPADQRQPLPSDPTMQSRITGVLGLIVVCLVAAGAIVGILYAAFLAVKGMFGG